MESITITVDWQQWILIEIGSPWCTRDDVATTYSYLLLKRSRADWRAINKAISARWPMGLGYIKAKAWRLATVRPSKDEGRSFFCK